MNKIKRSFLFIVFGISLAVSHYGTSYVYMFCLLAAWLILISIDAPTIQKLRNDFCAKFSRYKNGIFISNPISSNVKGRTISSCFVLLFVVFALSWYMYVSSSSTFNALVSLGDHIANSICTDFLNPETVRGFELMLTKPKLGLLHEVNRVINYLNQIFIIIGCIVLLLKYREMKFETEYIAFSMINLAILFAAISVPFLTALNMTRTYHLTLIFLAPFCVIGGITFFRMISRVAKVSWTDKSVKISLKILSVYFVIFLLYSSGFVYQVAEGYSGSIPLSQEGIKDYGDAKRKVTFYNCYIPEQDVFGARWLSENRDGATKVYADWSAYYFVLQSYGMIEERNILRNTTKVHANEYIYLKYLNVNYDLMSAGFRPLFNTTELSPIIDKKSRIYSNGGCYIYR